MKGRQLLSLDDIPKNTNGALKTILSKLLAVSQGNASIQALRMKGHQIYIDLVVGTTAAIKAAERLADKQVSEAIIENLHLRDEYDLDKIRQQIRQCLELVIAFEFDQHFLDSDDVEDFDQADIPLKDREDIRACLQKARNIAANADFLTDPVRRKFLHKVSLAENELFKEKVGFQAFLAAAYEGGRLLKQIGEDAKPMADALEKARTKTEQHISGYQQIEADKKPKQLPKPEND